MKRMLAVGITACFSTALKYSNIPWFRLPTAIRVFQRPHRDEAILVEQTRKLSHDDLPLEGPPWRPAGRKLWC